MQVVTFVSHQWLDSDHPDPEGRQLATLTDFIKNLIGNKVTVKSDVEAVMITNRCVSMSDKERAMLSTGYIWYDFASVPQCLSDTKECEETKQQQLQAILSIPAYVRESRFFLVLCPTQLHNSTGLICDLSSWKLRGWCRAEQMSWLLSAKAKAQVLVLRSPTQASYSAVGLRALMNPVGQGVFSQWEDRKTLYALLETLLDEAIQDQDIQSEEDTRGLFMKCIRTQVLRDLPPPGGQPQPSGTQEEQETFLADLGLESWLDLRAHGFTTLICAALSDNPRMVRAAMAAGVSPVWKTRTGLPWLNFPKGHAPMHLACLYSSADTVRALLEGRADVNQPGTSGFTPLVHACLRPETDSRAVDVVRVLIEHRAAVDKGCGHLSQTPINAACYGGSPSLVKELISKRADTNCIDSFGKRPLHSVAYWSGDVDVTRLLLQHRAEINSKVRAARRMTFANVARSWSWSWSEMSSTDSRLPTISPTIGPRVGTLSQTFWLKLFTDQGGFTALHLAAREGNWDCCEVLLQARADPAMRDTSDNTALDLALSYGHSEFEALFIGSWSRGPRTITITPASPKQLPEKVIMSI